MKACSKIFAVRQAAIETEALSKAVSGGLAASTFDRIPGDPSIFLLDRFDLYLLAALATYTNHPIILLTPIVTQFI